MAQTSRAQAHQLKLNYWQPIIDDWRNSRTTAKQYCRNHKLPMPQFKYWQYQLAPDTKKLNKRANAKSITFVPTQVIEHDHLQFDAQIELTTPNGYHFKISGSKAVSLAAKLFKELSC